MMRYWLTVHGGGSWSLDRKTYQGGPHEVSAEVYVAASEVGYGWLEVGFTVDEDEPPATAAPTDLTLAGPLTGADLARGTEDVRERQALDAATDQEAEASPPTGDVVAPQLEVERNADDKLACPVPDCDKQYVSEEAFQRHLAAKHPEVAS